MKSSLFVVCSASLGWLYACNDVPQAPPEVVPTAPPAKTIIIDSQFLPDYGRPIAHSSLVLSGSTTLGITYHLPDERQFRFAGCPIDCDQRRNWVVGDPDGSNGGDYSAAGAEDERFQSAYQFWGNGADPVLKYGSCSALCQHSSNWSTTTVDTTGVTGFFVSLAVRLGRTHIAYVTLSPPPSSNRLLYAMCSSNCSTLSAWTITTVDTNNYGETQIAVDAAGVVHLIYQSPDTGGHANLKYARCAAGCGVSENWQINTIGPGRLPSLAVHGLGNLTLAYADTGRGPIRVAACAAGCSAGIWNGAAVATPETPAMDVALAVQSTGRAYLAYGTRTDGVVYHGMIRRGSCASNCTLPASWQFLTVDSTERYRPEFVSLALDSAGHTAIAHADSYALRFTLVEQVP